MSAESFSFVPIRRPAAEVWIVAVAAVGGLVLWAVLMWPDKFVGYRSGDTWNRYDLVLGAAASAMLLLRDRRPRLVTFGLVLSTAIAISTVVAATLAVVLLTMRRQPRDISIVLALWIPSGLIYNAVHSSPYRGDLIANSIITVLTAVCAVATGAFLGARREAMANLTERLAAAEQEQALRAEKAISDERSRIARELHDVVAHRISLIALHSGALSIRSDMPLDDQQVAADTIRSNAHQALNELREILGVLRADALVDQVRPGLDALPRLLADSQAAGGDIQANINLPEHIPDSTSFHAYRIVQECLTNAAKHAPGEPVQLSLCGRDGGNLRIRISNPLPDHSAPTGPHSGLGLLGLTERARLSGGSLTYGVDADHHFFVTAWIAVPRSG